MMSFGIRWDHLQVCYPGNIHNRNVFEVCVVRGGYGDGGPMGQQSCLYILSRACSGSAPPFTVSDLFSRHFCVSWPSIYPCLSRFYTILFLSCSINTEKSGIDTWKWIVSFCYPARDALPLNLICTFLCFSILAFYCVPFFLLLFFCLSFCSILLRRVGCAFVCRYYGLPLHLVRELYETFRNFKARVADFIRYRKITSNMNDRFPDATTEELGRYVWIYIIIISLMTMRVTY